MAAGMFLSLSLSRVVVATAAANPIICTRHRTKKEGFCKQGQDMHSHAQAFAQGHHKYNTRAPTLPRSRGHVSCAAFVSLFACCDPLAALGRSASHCQRTLPGKPAHEHSLLLLTNSMHWQPALW